MASIVKRSKPRTKSTKSRTSRRKSAEAKRKATQKLAAEAAAEKEAEKVGSPVGNPTSLYSQARIVPNIDPQTNVVTGLKISAIQAGSVFENVGIQNGEIITEIDGVAIRDMGDSTKIMSALTDRDEVEVVTVDADGKPHQRILTPPR